MRSSVAVIGAGFYGCMVALELSKYFKHVALIEAEAVIMSRASYNNQARIHMGYHYPRSLTTGISCQRNHNLFYREFSDAVSNGYDPIYAIAKNDSKVTASDFEEYCLRIGAPLIVDKQLKTEYLPNGIERAYRVEEASFNIEDLRNHVQTRLSDSSVELRISTRVISIKSAKAAYILNVEKEESEHSIRFESIYICTYSNINKLLVSSGFKPITLCHELTEMPLFDTSHILPNISVTVMDGAFFSLLPFPAQTLNTLSHVSYTPHFSWIDDGSQDLPEAKIIINSHPRSNQRKMILDASKFMPDLAQARYHDSLWEIKTTLPLNALNDGRPILFKKCAKDIYVVLGGKLDNIYDIRSELKTKYRVSEYA